MMTVEEPTERCGVELGVGDLRPHRVWCSLWAEAWCDCGGVDPVDLVEWWAAAARRRPTSGPSCQT